MGHNGILTTISDCLFPYNKSNAERIYCEVEEIVGTYSERLHLIAIYLYKLGGNGILCKCILQHEREYIMRDVHQGLVGGNYARKATTHKIMCIGFWWLTIFHNTKYYCNSCDIC